MASKTFDEDLINTILNATVKNAGLLVDKESNSVSGLTFTINENAGQDEFGKVTFTKFYIFKRFKEGFFLTAVLCAG